MKEYRTCWKIGSASGRNVEALNKKHGQGTHWIEEREMSETTEGKSIPEALRLIAQWIEDRKEIEVFENHTGSWNLKWHNNFYMDGGNIYRARPRKPRTGVCHDGEIKDVWKAVELTPEVRACLEKEGLL